MKNLILAVLLLATTLLNSQTVIKTDQFRYAEWDAILEKFNYGEWKDANITFTATSNSVTVNDEAHSVYTFTSTRKTKNGKTTSGLGYVSFEWDCYDEKYRKCSFSIVKYNDGYAKVSVLYEKTLELLTYRIESSSNKSPDY